MHVFSCWVMMAIPGWKTMFCHYEALKAQMLATFLCYQRIRSGPMKPGDTEWWRGDLVSEWNIGTRVSDLRKSQPNVKWMYGFSYSEQFTVIFLWLWNFTVGLKCGTKWSLIKIDGYLRTSPGIQKWLNWFSGLNTSDGFPLLCFRFVIFPWISSHLY